MNQALADEVRRVLAQTGWTYRKLSDKAHVSPQTVQNLSQGRNVKRETLQKFVSGIVPADLFKVAIRRWEELAQHGQTDQPQIDYAHGIVLAGDDISEKADELTLHVGERIVLQPGVTVDLVTVGGTDRIVLTSDVIRLWKAIASTLQEPLQEPQS